jgi:hypothetical protein
MQYLMKAWKVVAYTYEADVHCVECAGDRFFVIKHGMVEDDRADLPEDSEGNTVQPVFASQVEGSMMCGDCEREVLDI